MAPDLDKNHLIPFELWFDEFPAGYPTIRISNAHATATIALHGAHVIDYIPRDQQPVIFTSVKAQFKEGKAIRGGIPVCWPWFAAHPSDSSKPSHGFARNRFWSLISSASHKDHTELVLTLDTFAPEVWEAPCTLTLTIQVGAQLTLQLTTTNTGSKDITVGGALHSYFCVSDAKQISITGLEGASYLDTVDGSEKSSDQPIRLSDEFDSIYKNTDKTVTVHDAAFNRSISIEKSGSLSTVVWNPWSEKAAALGDMLDEEYLDFVCVETANALDDVYQLSPGQTHTLGTTIRSTPNAQ